MKKNVTKQALFLSILSLMLCVSMLVASTYAWFTDTVTSGKNQIVAGNLDIELDYAKQPENGEALAWSSVEGKSDLIDPGALWEPGHTEVVYLRIRNEGTLALKYSFDIKIVDIVIGKTEQGDDIVLSEHLMYDVVDVTEPYEDRTAARDDIKDTAKGLTNHNISGSMTKGQDAKVVALVIYMPEDVGNEANYRGDAVPAIELGVTLVATQLASEKDSFDDTYDKDAEYPKVIGETLEENANGPVVLKVGNVTVAVPASAPAGYYKLTVTRFDEIENGEGEIDIDSDFSLTKDGEAVDPDAAEYDVTLKCEMMSTIKAVYHKDEEITDYTYDPFTGEIKFKTSSFSPFRVELEPYGYELSVDEEERTIKGGQFVGVNPANIDQSLKEDGSEYVVVDYIKDGEKHYAVSERATTVIVDDGAEASYVFENGDYSSLVKTSSSGKLYSIISALQGNEHSTVYILPGVYEESTAINVYSSMDILGLGDAEDIQIIKVKGSYSNRHLFNCNGAETRDAHIEVTIRNLYLDASAKNLNSAGKLYLTDNAAVQSIRLSKVKCYDLIIKKGSEFAFYVNGKYDARGAFLYADNCEMDTSSVVDYAPTYKFYYNDLTYSKGEYTTGTSDIKNEALEWNDWEW